MAENYPTTILPDDCWISLLSGEQFNYNFPEQSNVTIDDLASATSNICRFAGHLPRFYSVAQHLVNASRLVEGLTGDINDPRVFDALMHDTAEAFTNDLPTPLKWALPVFKELEGKIEAAMGEKFGFTFPYDPLVKEVDTYMLILEKFYVKDCDDDWPMYREYTRERVEPYRQYVDLASWQPIRAKREFLERYNKLKAIQNERNESLRVEAAESRKAA